MSLVDNHLAEQGELIARKVAESIVAFDFDTEVARICKAELTKYIQSAASAYFRRLLASPEAHAAVAEALHHHLTGAE